MACEVPVISTNAGGLAEVNIHGKTGYTSEIGNYEEMAQFALDLLQNDKKLESFRHAALEQAKKFNLGDIRLQYIELYKKLIKP